MAGTGSGKEQRNPDLLLEVLPGRGDDGRGVRVEAGRRGICLNVDVRRAGRGDDCADGKAGTFEGPAGDSAFFVAGVCVAATIVAG